MIDASSGGAPEQAPRWDLVDTESCGGGIRFLAPVLIVRGYVGIYRRKEYVGGALRGPRGRRARPPPLWAPRDSTDLFLPPIYSQIPQNQLEPRKHFSLDATFCTCEIPSRDLFRHPAGGGFDHGGHLHQLYCPSDEA